MNRETLDLWFSVDSDVFQSVDQICIGIEPNQLEEVTQVLDQMVEAKLLERMDAVQGYEKAADIYDARPFFSDELVELMLRHVGHEYRQRILDVGCGTGRLLARLAPYAKEWIGGLDLSIAMLAKAEAVLSTSPVPHELHPGIAEVLPFDSQSVSFLVVADALHWFQTDRFWSEARRVLAKKHRIAIIARYPDVGDSTFVRALGSLRGKRRPPRISVTSQLPRDMDIVHFEQVADTMLIRDVEQAIQVAQSWNMQALNEFSLEEISSVVRNVAGTVWPEHVHCTATVVVLEDPVAAGRT